MTRFYTGIPSQVEDPMWASYWSNRVLAMKRVGIHVTTRQLRYRKVIESDGREITTPQEKGIDVRLALDLVSLARKRQFDIALVFSQDQDLQEIVQEIYEISNEQSRWIVVACAFPSGPKATSTRGIDKTDWFRMDRTFYDQCLDHRDYRPAKYKY
jgi:uncharacterized LabA/DUF88 family protein